MRSVSVVIPSYNRAALLGRAVASVLSQTELPYEIFIVDDGSTDDTRRVLEGLSATVGPMLRWMYQPNGGEASARNAGLTHARGDYIAFLDSDDVWLPDKLERQMRLFARDDQLALTFSGYLWEDGPATTPVLLDEWDENPEEVIFRLMKVCCITPSTTIASRSVLTATGGFDSHMRLSCDWDMWVRIAASGGRIGYLPEITARYLWHDGNMSRDAKGVSEAALYLFLKLFAGRDLDPLIRSQEPWCMARWHMIHAENCLAAGAHGEARRHILQASRARPGSIRPGWLRILWRTFAKPR